MGNCYNSTNMGEDYLQTILLNLEVNKLFYKDINFWAISKKIELSNAEVRKEIESCNQSDKFKEETILLLESSTKEMLHFRDFENFASDKLCDNSSNNNHSSVQSAVLIKLFSYHFEFNFCHINLTLLSFLSDQKLDKVDYFYEICSKLKRNFTFDDFNIYLNSYLYNNLYTVSLVIFESSNNLIEEVKSDINVLIKRVYTIKNINTFKDNLVLNFRNKTDNNYIMTKDDLKEIFFDKEYLFNLKELRNTFLFIYREYL